ncbi:hypothetical protein R7Z80_17315 [Vibrio sp. 1733]|nr:MULTISPECIES: hypothetical protein [unclassified Vibrio]MDW1948636.1 hypothetical protein [Vibrio sp. 812(2023)]MDW1992024.1 hypothetical protein [Vibrio sp. 780]MDW2187618.1 hypothetical protein [Vibrio sp. 1733]MDW2237605.1 hypothetical protein [Vibrio sp. 1565-1]
MSQLPWCNAKMKQPIKLSKGMIPFEWIYEWDKRFQKRMVSYNKIDSEQR